MDNLILSAAAYAELKHSGQFRDDFVEGMRIPYIRHVIRVAGRVATRPLATAEMVAAAYLHDVIEDCGIRINEIEDQFDAKVSRIVLELTSCSKQYEADAMYQGITYLKPNRAERKRIDREYLKRVSPESKEIKMIDRIDNLMDTMLTDDAKWAMKYADESEQLLEEALLETSPDLRTEYRDLVAAIREKHK